MNLIILIIALFSFFVHETSGTHGYKYGYVRHHKYKRYCRTWGYGHHYRGPCHGQQPVVPAVPRPAIPQPEPPIVYPSEEVIVPQKPRPQPKPIGVPPIPFDNIIYKKCKTREGFIGFCREPAYCFHQWDNFKQLLENRCDFGYQRWGVCCPAETREPHIQEPLPFIIPKPYISGVGQIPVPKQQVIRAAEIARRVIEKRDRIERELLNRNFFTKHGTSAYFHQNFFGTPTDYQEGLSRKGNYALETTIVLMKKLGLTKEQARDGLYHIDLYGTPLEDQCLITPDCRKAATSKYRTADGTCNNLQFPFWGASNTVMERLVPPAYADGLNELRVSVDGGELPGPREVSVALARDVDLPDKQITLAVMQWGQFIDHDLTLASLSHLPGGEGIECCNEELRERRRDIMHPACIQIPIPEDDPFYSRFREDCINFVRNAASPRPGCRLGPREQTNQLTQLVDGSMVYGSDDERARYLRAFRGGLLRFEYVNQVEWLPFDTENRSDECAIEREKQERGMKCFVGGDVRVNEQTGLTVLHALLLREHNRIARKLAYLNPHWDDEILYQETRRIVAAVIQHITYNEWSPIVLGRRVMKNFNILPKTYGYTYDYDPKLNPNILNSFATAAYRFHTLIQGILQLQTPKGVVFTELMLRNLFNNPQTLYTPRNYDGYLNAINTQPAQTFDQHFTQEITQHLFQEHNQSFGMDLIALNIQRGREHGLQGYNHYRKVCGLPPVQSFEELDTVMRPGSAQAFASVYKYVDDIDLFVGLNHEKRLPDAIVGPTQACILAEQQRRNKLGDRFWYENGNMKHSFTEPQLNEIRKASLARMICDNSNDIKYVQPLALLQPSKFNPKIHCDNIPYLNLNHWKGEPTWH